MTSWITITIISINLAACIIYLIVNIVLQIKGKKKLEIILRLDRVKLQRQFAERKKASGNDSDVSDELKLMMIREEIRKLQDGLEKTVLEKTLNRKNYNNQKKFAQSILDQSELAVH
jgi:hypothetical protein